MEKNEKAATLTAGNNRLFNMQIGREVTKTLKDRIYERMLDHYTNFGDVDGAESSYKVDGWEIRMNTERYEDVYSMGMVLIQPEWMVAAQRHLNYPADTTLCKECEADRLWWMKEFAYDYAQNISYCTSKEIAQQEMEPIY